MKIGFGAICKNEQLVAKRLLDSIVGKFDRICIVDTGSTDDTVNIIKQYPNIDLIQVDFGNHFSFAAARNIYIDWLNDKVEYAYTADYDDIITEQHLSDINKLVQEDQFDIVGFQYATGADRWHRHYRLWKTKLGIRYSGACHEFLVTPPGCRFLNSNSQVYHLPLEPNHYEDSAKRNLAILNSLSSRTLRETFYLANTYRDLGKTDQAFKLYLEYLANKDKAYYHDELMMCYIYAARYADKETAITLALEGISVDNTWAELHRELAYRTGEQYYNQLADQLVFIEGRLFSEKWAYKK